MIGIAVCVFTLLILFQITLNLKQSVLMYLELSRLLARMKNLDWEKDSHPSVNGRYDVVIKRNDEFIICHGVLYKNGWKCAEKENIVAWKYPITYEEK